MLIFCSFQMPSDGGQHGRTRVHTGRDGGSVFVWGSRGSRQKFCSNVALHHKEGVLCIIKHKQIGLGFGCPGKKIAGFVFVFSPPLCPPVPMGRCFFFHVFLVSSLVFRGQIWLEHILGCQGGTFFFVGIPCSLSGEKEGDLFFCPPPPCFPALCPRVGVFSCCLMFFFVYHGQISLEHILGCQGVFFSMCRHHLFLRHVQPLFLDAGCGMLCIMALWGIHTCGMWVRGFRHCGMWDVVRKVTAPIGRWIRCNCCAKFAWIFAVSNCRFTIKILN